MTIQNGAYPTFHSFSSKSREWTNAKIKQELYSAHENMAAVDFNYKVTHYNDSSIIGQLNGYLFRRGSYFYMVKGDVPLELAKMIERHGEGLLIRVAGGHESNKPEDWSKVKNQQRLMDEFITLGYEKSFDELVAYGEKLDQMRPRVVDGYHIDTLEGLRLFCKLIVDYDARA